MVSKTMIPDRHFHKKWQIHVKTWFDQPMKKKRRHIKRMKKIIKSAPRPVDPLRPVVHCPSFRYNSRVRIGRGFSLAELKAAKINKHFARTIGIAVDHRRRNRSLEFLQVNKERLLKYKANLIMDKNKPQQGALVREGLNKVGKPVVKKVCQIPTDEEKKFSAFVALRQARAEQKNVGRRIRRNKLAQGAEDVPTKPSSKKKRAEDDE